MKLTMEEMEVCFNRSKEWLEGFYSSTINGGLKSIPEWESMTFDKVYFSKTSRKVFYYTDDMSIRKKSNRYKDKQIWIGLRKPLRLYHHCRKTSLGLITPISGLEIYKKDRNISLELCFIHELTHHIQFITTNKINEVDSTENETIYLLEKRPYYYFQLVPYEVRRKQENDKNTYRHWSTNEGFIDELNTRLDSLKDSLEKKRKKDV